MLLCLSVCLKCFVLNNVGLIISCPQFSIFDNLETYPTPSMGVNRESQIRPS